MSVNVIDWIFGKPLASDEEDRQTIGPLAGIPVLGLDALSSAAYGPEAALTLLIPLGLGGLSLVWPITVTITVVLLILYFSYRQTISAYPGGGGTYTVARENLGMRWALPAGAALALDYILNVAVGISAGVGALVSAFPVLLPHTLAICLVILGLLTLVNMRGLRESGLAFMVPTYVFVGTLGLTVMVGVIQTLSSGGHPHPVVPPPSMPPVTQAAGLWVLARAFAAGCTAMTGVEAVSNGVPIFRKPSVPLAQRTLTFVVLILVVLLLGIAWLCRSYGIAATDPGAPGYQSVLSMLVGAVMGQGIFYYVTMASVVAVLALSANTSFADFPRLLRVLAEDRFLPDAYSMRGRRLVYANGIVALAVLSGILLIAFGGITDKLIPLFAIGAFLAFTISQAGMVQHWRRIGGPEARHSLPLNAIGAVATGLTLIVVVVSKFMDGAWVTVVLVPSMVIGFRLVHRHYDNVAEQVACPTPLKLEGTWKPVAIVMVQSWNKVTERGLQIALNLAPEVYAVQVKSEAAKMHDLTTEWEQLVVTPARAAGFAAPKLVVRASNYRQVFKPLLEFVLQIRDANPDRVVLVVIPDLVVKHWYQGLLHNNRGMVFRTLLRFLGGPRVVVVNPPFPLHD